MQGHSIKYARGTVWLCKDDEYSESSTFGFRSTTHIQRKTRPVLIVSNNIGNANSPVVNVVPLTTQDKRSSVVVALCSESGALSCILCNQIKTVDKSQLIQYEFTVDDETMAEVERTIQFALDIRQQTIDKSLKDIEDTVGKIVKMKFDAMTTRKDLDTTVEHVIKGLESTYSQLMSDYLDSISTKQENLEKSSKVITTAIKNKSVVSTDSSFNESKSNCNIETKDKKKTRKIKSRGFWTTEVKQQFILDCETKSMDYIMEVYCIDSPKQVKKRMYNYRWELKSAGLLND